MDNQTIYTKLTYNIQSQITKFNENKLSKETLNQKLLVDLSSLCFFLKNREKKKESQPTKELNETILDVYVPYSKLSKILKQKLENINPIEEEDILDKIDELDIDLLEQNSSKHNIHNDLENLIMDDNEIEAQPANDKYLLDDSQSVNMSFFNKPLESNTSISPSKSGVSTNFKDTLGSMLANRNGNTISSRMPTTISTGSDDSSGGLKNSSQVKEALEEFKNVLPEKLIIEGIKVGNIDILKGCMFLYNTFKEYPGKNLQENKVLFLHRLKEFILNLGLTDKTMYESCIRSFIYNKKSLDFIDFFECCLKIMKLDFEQNYIKYKCILIYNNAI